MVFDPVSSGVTATMQPRSETDLALFKAAQQLESQFLAEMLKSTGFKGEQNAFSGGAGEEQFQSFLRDAQAERIVSSGGIGLAETIFKSLRQGG